MQNIFARRKPRRRRVLDRPPRLDDPRQITLFKTAEEAKPEEPELPGASEADAKPDKKTRKTKIKAEDVPAKAGEAKAE